jgi:glutathione peroxidase
VEPKWNFHKFLVDRNGKVAASYSSSVEPDNSNLVAALEKALVAKP